MFTIDLAESSSANLRNLSDVQKVEQIDHVAEVSKEFLKFSKVPNYKQQIALQAIDDIAESAKHSITDDSNIIKGGPFDINISNASSTIDVERDVDKILSIVNSDSVALPKPEIIYVTKYVQDNTKESILKAEIKKLQALVKKLQDTKVNNSTILDKLKDKLARTQNELEECKKKDTIIADYKARMDALSEEVKQLQQANRDIQAKVTVLETQLNKVNARLKYLNEKKTEIQRTMYKFNQKNRVMMRDRFNAVDAVDDVVAVDKIIVPNEENGRGAVDVVDAVDAVDDENKIPNLDPEEIKKLQDDVNGMRDMCKEFDRIMQFIDDKDEKSPLGAKPLNYYMDEIERIYSKLNKYVINLEKIQQANTRNEAEVLSSIRRISTKFNPTRANTIYNELNAIITSSLRMMQEFTEEKKRLNTENARLNTENAEKKQQLATAVRQLSEMRQTLLVTQQTLSDSIQRNSSERKAAKDMSDDLLRREQERAEEAETAKALAEREKLTAEQALKDAQVNMQQLRTDITSLNERNSSLMNNINRLQESLRLIPEMKNKIGPLTDNIERTEAQLRALQAEKADVDRQLDDKHRLLEKAQRELGEAKSTIITKDTEIQQLKNDTARLKEKLRISKITPAPNPPNESNDEKMEQLRQELASVNAAIIAANSRAAEAESKLAEEKKKLNALEAESKKQEGKMNNLMRMNNEADITNKQLKFELSTKMGLFTREQLDSQKEAITKEYELKKNVLTSQIIHLNEVLANKEKEYTSRMLAEQKQFRSNLLENTEMDKLRRNIDNINRELSTVKKQYLELQESQRTMITADDHKSEISKLKAEESRRLHDTISEEHKIKNAEIDKINVEKETLRKRN